MFTLISVLYQLNGSCTHLVIPLQQVSTTSTVAGMNLDHGRGSCCCCFFFFFFLLLLRFPFRPLVLFQLYFCTFLDPLKHNQINLVNLPNDYLVKLIRSRLTQIYHIISAKNKKHNDMITQENQSGKKPGDDLTYLSLR